MPPTRLAKKASEDERGCGLQTVHIELKATDKCFQVGWAANIKLIDAFLRQASLKSI